METWGVHFSSSKNWSSRKAKNNKLAAYKMRMNYSSLNYRKEKKKENHHMISLIYILK